METQWIWLIAAVVVLGTEMLTGTVYLLMVALGLMAGGIAHWAGVDMSTQIFVAAAVTAAGCLVVKKRMARRQAKQRVASPHMGDVQRDPAVQMDVGNSVMVSGWGGVAESGESISLRNTTVVYRGARWQAVLDAPYEKGYVGEYRIAAVQGSTLVLSPVAVNTNV